MRQVSFKYNNKPIDLWIHDDEYISNVIAERGAFYEADILEQLRRHFPKQNTMVDAGANIGNHSVYFLNFFSPKRLVCFEPLPFNYQLLLKNIENYKNVKIDSYPIALGALERRVALQYVPGNLGMCNVIYDQPGDVEMRSLDSFELEEVSFLKIDVEHSFLEVIRGALDTIARCRPVILTEGAFEKIFPVIGPLGYVCTGLWSYDVLMYLYQPLLRR